MVRNFDYQRWWTPLRSAALIPIFYDARERSMDEILRGFIDTGVTKEFLKREWNNAMKRP